MGAENKSGMACHEFESLLSEVLDHRLTGPKLEQLQMHAAQCGLCGPLLQEAEAGQHWLKSLAEVEPPAMLVDGILAATSGAQPAHRTQPARAQKSWWEEFSANTLRPILTPMLGLMRQPRFAMSFGMAFFSLSVTLNVAGVKLSSLRHIDLRPNSVRRAYYETSGKIAKYYDNMRFVYEIESRVREFKQVAEPEPAEQKEKEKTPDHKGRSGQPDSNQQRNYSRGGDDPVVAFSDQSHAVKVDRQGRNL
jgi:hypothetical protein